MMKEKIFTVDKIQSIYNEFSEEKETTICISGNDKMMDVYTSDNVMLNKLKKLFSSNPDTIECWEAGRTSDGKVTGYFFKMDKKHLSFRTGSNREMTEEQKAAFGARIKKLHAEGKISKKKIN